MMVEGNEPCMWNERARDKRQERRKRESQSLGMGSLTRVEHRQTWRHGMLGQSHNETERTTDSDRQ